MTDCPFQDSVAIDTNVFVHLLNPQNNTENHINQLLVHLQQQDIVLLVDCGGRIAGEYYHHLAPIIRRTDDERNERYILRYWLEGAPRSQITVNGSSPLMATIKGVIKEPSETVDRIFVYVTFSQGKLLVSNDVVHIVSGPARESRLGSRRQRLVRDSRRLCPPGAEILTSQEAHDMI